VARAKNIMSTMFVGNDYELIFLIKTFWFVRTNRINKECTLVSIKIPWSEIFWLDLIKINIFDETTSYFPIKLRSLIVQGKNKLVFANPDRFHSSCHYLVFQRVQYHSR
jgi:hypothetical protein